MFRDCHHLDKLHLFTGFRIEQKLQLIFGKNFIKNLSHIIFIFRIDPHKFIKCFFLSILK